MHNYQTPIQHHHRNSPQITVKTHRAPTTQHEKAMKLWSPTYRIDRRAGRGRTPDKYEGARQILVEMAYSALVRPGSEITLHHPTPYMSRAGY